MPENLSFLENEKTVLEKLLKLNAFSNNSQIKARLEFIQKGRNTLRFSEENIKQNTLIKETDETQLSTIEIDGNDLQKILSVIEGRQNQNSLNDINAPQLIIKNFLLNKARDNIFLLDLKLLKREFFKKKNND